MPRELDLLGEPVPPPPPGRAGSPLLPTSKFGRVLTLLTRKNEISLIVKDYLPGDRRNGPRGEGPQSSLRDEWLYNKISGWPASARGTPAELSCQPRLVMANSRQRKADNEAITARSAPSWARRHLVRRSGSVDRDPVGGLCKADQRGRVAPMAAAMNLGASSWTRTMSGRKRMSTNPAASMAPFHCPGVRNPPLGR